MLTAQVVAAALNTTLVKVNRAAALIRDTNTAFGVQSGRGWKYRTWEIDQIKALLAKGW